MKPRLFQQLRPLMIYFIIALLFLCGIYLAARHLFKTDEQLVKELIYKARRAVEKEDVGTLAALTSEDYRGYYGRNKREAIIRARHDFTEVESLDIDIDEITIEINKNEAKTIIYFYASGTYLGSSIYNKVPFRGLVGPGEEPDKVRAIWRKEPDGQWKIIELELHLK